MYLDKIYYNEIDNIFNDLKFNRWVFHMEDVELIILENYSIFIESRIVNIFRKKKINIIKSIHLIRPPNIIYDNFICV